MASRCCSDPGRLQVPAFSGGPEGSRAAAEPQTPPWSGSSPNSPVPPPLTTTPCVCLGRLVACPQALPVLGTLGHYCQLLSPPSVLAPAPCLPRPLGQHSRTPFHRGVGRLSLLPEPLDPALPATRPPDSDPAPAARPPADPFLPTVSAGSSARPHPQPHGRCKDGHVIHAVQ